MNTNRKIKVITLFSLCLVLLGSSLGLSACGQKGEGIRVDIGSLLGIPMPEAEKEPVPKAIWPFTGVPTDDPLSTYLRPISVKIENSKAARPQTNIHQADIVYESEIEGGETRFNCIFHSTIPDVVGNVRSARMTDLWIVPQYNTILIYSGANRIVYSEIQKAKLSSMVDNGSKGFFYRTKDKRAPHNLFINMKDVYATARSRKTPIETANDRIAQIPYATMYKEEKGAMVETSVATDFAWVPATKINVDFSGASKIEWNWDDTNKVYLRSQGGSPHMEKTSDKQLSTKNVVVMYAVYTQMSIKDPAGSATFDTNLGGTGKAIFFRDGKRVDCTWESDRNTPPVFKDASGNIIPFDVGNTWFQVIRTTASATSS